MSERNAAIVGGKDGVFGPVVGVEPPHWTIVNVTGYCDPNEPSGVGESGPMRPRVIT